MEWQPIQTAPHGRVIILAVRSHDGERRTFVASAGVGQGGIEWQVTTGWMGWDRLHGAWTPTHWMSLPEPPKE